MWRAGNRQEAEVPHSCSRWSAAAPTRLYSGSPAYGRAAAVEPSRLGKGCPPDAAVYARPMIVGEASTTVSATPNEVFDFVLDLNRYRQADHKIGRVGTIDNEGDRGTVRFSGRIRGLPGPSGTYPFTRTESRLGFGSPVRLAGSSTSRARSIPNRPVKAPWSHTGRCSSSSDRGVGSPNRSFAAGWRTTPLRRWSASRSSSSGTPTPRLPSGRRPSQNAGSRSRQPPSSCCTGRRSQRHALFYVRSVTRMKGNANEVTKINARTAYTHPGRRTSPFPARTRTRSA